MAAKYARARRISVGTSPLSSPTLEQRKPRAHYGRRERSPAPLVHILAPNRSANFVSEEKKIMQPSRPRTTRGNRARNGLARCAPPPPPPSSPPSPPSPRHDAHSTTLPLALWRPPLNSICAPRRRRAAESVAAFYDFGRTLARSSRLLASTVDRRRCLGGRAAAAAIATTVGADQSPTVDACRASGRCVCLSVAFCHTGGDRRREKKKPKCDGAFINFDRPTASFKVETSAAWRGVA